MSAPQPAQPSKAKAGEEEVARKRLFRGTRLCKFFLAGCCSRGDACNFAHSSDDLQDLPDFSKTRLCDPFMRSGVCEQGYSCKFAHSQDELRPSYISKSKANRSPDRPKKEKETQAQPAGERQDQTVQLQGLPPGTQAGLLHSAALYTLILQGLNAPGASSSTPGSQGPRGQAPQGPQGSQGPHAQASRCQPDSPVQAGRVVSASPREKYSVACWSRQTTADVGDDRVAPFSRQTTEEPQSTLFRQVTDEARRPLPLSQLLSLPEPDEPSDSQDATIDASDVVDPVESHPVSHHSDGSDGGSEELQVKLKNTFLHWEPVRSPDHVMSLRRSRSLPISLPEDGRSSIDVRN